MRQKDGRLSSLIGRLADLRRAKFCVGDEEIFGSRSIPAHINTYSCHDLKYLDILNAVDAAARGKRNRRKELLERLPYSRLARSDSSRKCFVPLVHPRRGRLSQSGNG